MIPSGRFALKPLFARKESANARFFGIFLCRIHDSSPASVGNKSKGSRPFFSSSIQMILYKGSLLFGSAEKHNNFVSKSLSVYTIFLFLSALKTHSYFLLIRTVFHEPRHAILKTPSPLAARWFSAVAPTDSVRHMVSVLEPSSVPNSGFF